MDGEAQVKTLGQIAFDAYQSLDREEQYKWESCSKWWQGVWESTAKAVRAAVIDECAAEFEKELSMPMGISTIPWITSRIRALK